MDEFSSRPALSYRFGKVRPMLRVVHDPASGDDRSTPGTSPSSLRDEIAREGARRMRAEVLQAEWMPTSLSTPVNLMSRATGWWCVTDHMRRERS